MLRHWSNRPRPHIDDAEIMITRGAGRGLIHNERVPLWRELERHQGMELDTVVRLCLTMLEGRLRRFTKELAAAQVGGA